MTKKQTVSKNNLRSFLQKPITLSLAPASEHDVATMKDLKSALLIVSLVVNVGVLIGWIALQVTTHYDYQIASFLFIR